MIGATFILAAALGGSAVPTEVPGLEALWRDDKLRWLVVGEDHGTVEEPAVFLDIIGKASLHRKVSAGVEQPASEQNAIDAYISSEGGKVARLAFQRSIIWQNEFKDGRSSTAMWALFDGFRALHAAGRLQSIIALMPSAGEAGDYEKAMADELSSHSPIDTLTIALVGNVHAMRSPVIFASKTYMPMAGDLPKAQTMTVKFQSTGGEQWACTSMSAAGCKAQRNGRAVSRHKPAVIRTPNSDGYDAIVDLGIPTTASAPLVPSRQTSTPKQP